MSDLHLFLEMWKYDLECMVGRTGACWGISNGTTLRLICSFTSVSDFCLSLSTPLIGNDPGFLYIHTHIIESAALS